MATYYADNMLWNAKAAHTRTAVPKKTDGDAVPINAKGYKCENTI